MFSSKCTVCDRKKSRFIEEQEPNGWISSLRMKAPVSKVSLIGSILF